jgi:cytochrome c-type biogenesis protein CcmH
MLWAAILILAGLVAGALLWPFLRRSAAEAARAEYDLAIYRDQLSEIERELARGVIGAAEAAAARTEIARRMLAADAARGDAASPGGVASGSRRGVPAWAALVALAVPLLALALYLATGAPELPGRPLAERPAAPSDDPSAREIEGLARELAQRLESRPDDVAGWALLARTYGTLGRYEAALGAWRRVRALAPDDPQFAAPFAETLVQVAGGMVTPAARAAFEQTLAAEPFDPRALFYRGLAEAQAGENRAALQSWTDLIHVSPPDAPWLAVVRARRAETAAHARIDVATLKPSPEAEAQRARAGGR